MLSVDILVICNNYSRDTQRNINFLILPGLQDQKSGSIFLICQQSSRVKVLTREPNGLLHNMRIKDVVSFNGAPSIDPLWSMVSVHECENEDYDIKSVDKILVAMLINMKHYTSGPSNNIRLRYGGNSQNSASKTAQYLKLCTPKLDITYDRIFFFADLMTTGKCFAIIAETVQMSEFLMTYAQHGISIGNMFAISEPDQVTRALKGGLPLIETSKPLYPLTTCGPIEAVPLVIPETGRQNYFYLKNVEVQLNRVEAARVSCNGTLCDHQNPMMRGGSCGCLYFNRYWI
jgi:hypothetical protein